MRFIEQSFVPIRDTMPFSRPQLKTECSKRRSVLRPRTQVGGSVRIIRQQERHIRRFLKYTWRVFVFFKFIWEFYEQFRKH
jgi:hypothetical protein